MVLERTTVAVEDIPCWNAGERLFRGRPRDTAMRLPARSADPWIPEPAPTRKPPPSTNVMGVKSTFSWRQSDVVVEPHSMSTVPLATASTRFSGVTARSSPRGSGA